MGAGMPAIQGDLSSHAVTGLGPLVFWVPFPEDIRVGGIHLYTGSVQHRIVVGYLILQRIHCEFQLIALLLRPREQLLARVRINLESAGGENENIVPVRSNGWNDAGAADCDAGSHFNGVGSARGLLHGGKLQRV